MSTVPFAIPLVWTTTVVFLLQVGRFEREIGRDCLRYRRFFR